MEEERVRKRGSSFLVEGRVQSGDAQHPGGQRRVLVLLGPLGGCAGLGCSGS